MYEGCFFKEKKAVGCRFTFFWKQFVIIKDLTLAMIPIT